MMTQPIQVFENLTSETSPAGGNALTKMGFSFDDRRLIEREARLLRAAAVAETVTDALLWVRRHVNHLMAGIKADLKLRAAEAQLSRMSDRELSDLGLCRADIHFAVRERTEGVMPQFDAVAGHGTPANQNVRRAA
ncbi:MAG: DUF1127 domain-containing protein [Enhydrobacter sp.]|nr:DUF1127 domain-containing protein [Enhydrobacter sp.]